MPAPGRLDGERGDRAMSGAGASSGSRRHRLAGGLSALAIVLAVVASFACLAVDFSALFSAEGRHAMAGFVAEFFPADLSAPLLRQVGFGALQTLAVSALGTGFAAIGGALLALPAAGRLGRGARWAARFALNVLRSVPELVWAALMVLAAGLGPFAGVLALALHTTGVLGRLFAESLENASPAPETALRELGAGAAASFGYGTLPVIAPQCLGYTLYRWEMNIRMAAILGFVGAGGLGQMLYYFIELFQRRQAATVLLGMAVLVLAVDAASAAARKALSAHAA
jgi:phosphonate transport system permease protein